MRHQEWHVTVEGDPVRWHSLCERANIKPLYIELNNFERQLMCAAKQDPRDFYFLTNPAFGFTTVRVKHEVERILDGETALYYECHVKFDGPFRSQFEMTSRDLYRQHRWYMTLRQEQPFEPLDFVGYAKASAPESRFIGFEYEACLLDTNKELDKRWR